ncbi:sugar transferase [Candidatus Parcubacteria bacterium]|nr:MAG: sugar transferase [Candidatus Parcubacteria bacterium]
MLRNKRFYLAIKRGIDVVGALVGLILFGPLMLIIAIAIKLDSPGPVFFVQKAIGKGGRPFNMIKFRSMYHGADNTEHKRFTEAFVRGEDTGRAIDPRTGQPVYKIVNDPRITRVGRFLRRTGLDEAPQFFNVLKGDMSLVGPRPPLPYEYSLYDDWAKQRLLVRPGITGLHQIRKRSRANFREMVETDLEYIENMSLWLDIKLLLLTIPVITIMGKGAY